MDRGTLDIVIIPVAMFLAFMLVLAWLERDKGVFEHCREKHSKQVCINILQETGK